MDPDDLGPWHRKQTERIPVAQILFGRKRKAGKIRQRPPIVWMRAHGNAFRAIGLDVVVGVSNRPFQTSELQALELVPAATLDRLEVIGCMRSSRRRNPGRLSAAMRGSHAPPDVRPWPWFRCRPSLWERDRALGFKLPIERRRILRLPTR
jgi:hypothetical protein